ncbi:MAG: hypothetical protein WA364_20510 [Candidatus Nitrosopolaris sp.]
MFETPLLSITLFVGDQNIFAAFELYLPAEAADIFVVDTDKFCKANLSYRSSYDKKQNMLLVVSRFSADKEIENAINV